MYLQNLSLINFKNFESADIQFDRGINCFVGNNGQGKTNLLDALYYLSFCKSYFNPVDSQNIKHSEEFFVIQGNFIDGENTEHIHCGVKKGNRKVFKRNKKEYEKLADHIGLFPLVMISPYDADLINEGSDVRRKFLDGIISQFSRQYLDNLQQYNRALKQRNMLLKQFFDKRNFNAEMLEVYDEQLIHFGQPIFEERKNFLEEFRLTFEGYFRELSDAEELPGIAYETQLWKSDWKDLFTEHRQKDRQSLFTNSGIHKDDLIFELNGYPIKKFGSQGQQKTFLIALKLAQYHIIKNKLSKIPLLLLDDIFDKIDDRRVGYLMKLINDNEFGQIFITDTERDRVEKILGGISVSHRIFEIRKGIILNEA